MKRAARDFQKNDVVYIFAQKDFKATTGVVNRIDADTDMVNVFVKGNQIGTWFFKSTLKRIGGKGGTK